MSVFIQKKRKMCGDAVLLWAGCVVGMSMMFAAAKLLLTARKPRPMDVVIA